MKFFALSILVCTCCFSGYAQYSIAGTITDENNLPLQGSHVHTPYMNTITNEQGKFILSPLPVAEMLLYVSHLGYAGKDTLIDLHQNIDIHLKLLPDTDALGEIIIQQTNVRQNGNTETVSEVYIRENFSGSLAKSLERLPGINATEIGAGASKPIIRGLGFNRVVVSENGIKHEGQQWGADHGLEIDAFSAEEIEIIRSSGAIEYGSDAIGGVINIRNDIIPQKESFSGEYTLHGKSVNNTFANSLQIQSRKDKFFYKLKATTSDYGDYNIPTDTIVYLTVKMPIYNNRLKNTAGRERHLLGQVGYVSDRFHSILTASNTYTKAGFFPGSHGIPSIARVQDDGNSRNIDYPYQRVNHFKITSANKWLLQRTDLFFSASYQNNHRQERSEFHTHFGNQPPPEKNSDIELNFDLHTFDVQGKLQHFFSTAHKAAFGIQGQFQDNNINGYGFLLPEYKRNNIGAFATYDYVHSEKLSLNFGIRGDYASLKTERFYDEFLYEYLINRGMTEAQAHQFATRSNDISREFSNFSMLAGLVYQPNERWDYSLTAGTNFRLPTAIELAANGIHHGSFRHERGNPDLNPEKGFAIDAKVAYQKEDIHISLSPFLYYFNNYIFLKPSGTFSPLPHGGQIYDFTQSKALLTGVEFSVEKTFFKSLKTLLVLEYLYNMQITDSRATNYPLPFSPPANGFLEVGYLIENTERNIQNITFSANSRFATAQQRTAQNEQTTDGFAVFGLGITTHLVFNRFQANVSLQATNIFNTRYFNHTNFYRALEIPEMGRNIQLMIRIPFGTANG